MRLSLKISKRFPRLAKAKGWMMRLGVWYLVFCTVKGLVWVAVGVGAWKVMD